MVEEALVDVVVFVVVEVDDIDFLLQAMVYYYVVMDSSLLDDDNDYFDLHLVINCY
jgi:hypothetical protein